MVKAQKNNKPRVVVVDRKTTRAVVPRGPRAQFDVDTEMYLRALKNPFDPTVEGVRVPDRFPFPTATYHAHIVSKALITTGTPGLFALLPSASLCYVASDALNINNLTTGLYLPTVNAPVAAAVSDANLAATFSAARTVAWGVRIKNNTNFSTVAGRIVIAPFVIGKQCLSQGALVNLTPTAVNGTNLAQDLLTSLSGTDGFTLGSIAELPGAVTYGVDELINGEVMITHRPIDPTGYEFKNTSNAQLATTNGGSSAELTTPNDVEVLAAGITAINNGAQMLFSEMNGQIGYLLFLDGLPTGSPLSIEWIFHLEGTPRITTTTGGNIVPSGAIKHRQPRLTSVEQILGFIQSEPVIKFVQPIAAAMAKSFLSRMVG